MVTPGPGLFVTAAHRIRKEMQEKTEWKRIDRKIGKQKKAKARMKG
jgi:hypothetical protein